MKVNVYIDGFNLFYGLKSLGAKANAYKWLDPALLGTNLLRKGQTLNEVKFFTARIKSSDLKRVQRQSTYIEALEAKGIKVYEGKFVSKKIKCKLCKNPFPVFEEKESDVNLATELVVDAALSLADVFIVITADSDLVLPMHRTKYDFGKRVIPVFPPNRRSVEIRSRIGKPLFISPALLRRSLLPNTITKADGYILQRPAKWW